MATDSRRHGVSTGFWNNVAVQANGYSQPQYLGQGVDQLVLYLKVSGVTNINLLAAPSTDLTVEGFDAEHGSTEAPAVASFYPVYWQGTQAQIVFSGAGTRAVIWPDFAPGWIMLQSTGAVTITAGWEASSL